jgi:hypothetical protein
MRIKTIISIISFFTIAPVYSQQWNRLNNGGISGGGQVVMDLSVFKDSLCVMGGYSFVGGNAAQNFALYDSLNWRIILPSTVSYAEHMIEYNGELILLGPFLNAGNNMTADNIAAWNGVTWTALTGGSATNNGTFHNLVIYNGDLIAIGPTMMNNVNGLNFVAKWNGSVWSGVSGGVTGGTTDAWSGCVYQNELYVGGRFFAAGGTPATNIAKWNGTQWFNVGDANAEVMYMVVDSVNDVLYTCGYYNVVGGVSATGISKYDGENWYPVGGGLDLCGGWALEMYQNQLYVAGCFLEASGDTSIKYVSRFDGQNWKSLTTGVDAGVFDLQVYKDELYVGGGFTKTGDTVVTALARWSYPLDSACSSMFADILPHPDTLYLADAPFKFKSGCYGNSSLQWNFSDGFTSTAGQPVYNFNTTPGTYTIELIAQCGTQSDTATSTVVIVNNIGIDEINNEKIEMVVYPNPASGEITFNFKKMPAQNSQLVITDITGKTVYTKKVQNGSERINTNNWESGTYVGSLLLNGKTISQSKFVIK